MVTMIMQKTGNDGDFYLGITRAGEEARDSYISPFFHRQHLAICNLIRMSKRRLQKNRSLVGLQIYRTEDKSYNLLIISWGYFGDIFGIFWGYLWDILGISSGYWGISSGYLGISFAKFL